MKMLYFNMYAYEIDVCVDEPFTKIILCFSVIPYCL